MKETNNSSTTKTKSSQSADEFNTSSTSQLPNSEVSVHVVDADKSWGTRQGKHSTSDVGALLHVIKSSMGSGFLALPYAYRNAGILLGFIGTAFVGILCTHCTHVVVKCSQKLCSQLKVESLGYTETIENAIKCGPNKRLTKYSSFVKCAVNCLMFFTYYGVNTIYVIFVSTTFKQVVENYTDLQFNIRIYILVLTAVLLPVGIVRHIKFLVPFSAFANIFLLVGSALTLFYIVQDLPPVSSRPLAVEPTRLPLFFSIALTAMEGIGTIMPIENAMRKPSHFLGCPGVLNIGMAVVCSMLMIVGFLGYLRYGDQVEVNVTLNLPQDIVPELVKVLVALAVLFTYGLQLTASMVVVWSGLEHRFSESSRKTAYYVVRASMILGTVAIAVAVPKLSPVISLVGAVGFSSLGILFPAVAEISMNWDSHSFVFILFKDITLIIIYIFALVTGTIISFKEMIEQYSLS